MTHPLTDDLLKWYRQNKRSLPWRDNRTPYGTLVSEVMLQQTRVDTVVSYYNNFMERFPTVEDLASADLDVVLSMWSGLGYYSRARNLHKSAKSIVEAGEFPSTLKEIRALSGVGEYIAGAIASMAFDLDVAAIDGNLHRVLSRVYCDGGDRKKMWSVIEPLLPKGECGDFNQALMDLGSSHCAKKYTCTDCPIQQHCLAFKTGKQDEFPVPTKKKAKAEEAYVALLIRNSKDSDLLWMGQRPTESLYGGMVEPCLIRNTESSDQSCKDWLDKNLQLNKLPTHCSVEWVDKGRFVHMLTHKRMSIRVIEGTLEYASHEFADANSGLELIFADSQIVQYDSQRWYDANQRSKVGISTLAQKVFAQSSKGQLSLF